MNPLTISLSDRPDRIGGHIPTSKFVPTWTQYVLHFDKDGMPPVNAFWSITLCDPEGFQVGNRSIVSR